MTILDQIRQDVTTAMRAGERRRVEALRLVLSELQRAAKDGAEDEVITLRRERKRRLDADRAYREAASREPHEAGRLVEAADRELEEAQMIAAYLPAELDDSVLVQLVDAAVAATGASGMRDMGAVMRHVKEASDGRADGARTSALVRARLG